MLVEIRPLKTEEDYQAALQEVEALFDAPVGTPDGNRLEVLVTLVEVYEAEHCEMPLPVLAIEQSSTRRSQSESSI